MLIAKNPLAFAAQSNEHRPTKPSRLQQKIANSFRKTLTKVAGSATYGFILTDVNSKQPIFKHAAHTPLIPASNQKLLVSLLAFETLKPEYRFVSSLSVGSDIKQYQKINQDIVFYSNGNPSFVTEDLFRMILNLQRKGVEEINGDLIIDYSYFSPGIDFPQTYDQKANAYNAATTATALNFGSIEFMIRPSQKIGKACQIDVYPPSPTIQIVNKTKTVDKKQRRAPISIKRQGGTDSYDRFIILGSAKADSPPQISYRFARQPLLYLANSIVFFLKKFNIRWQGKIRLSSTKVKTQFNLVTITSKHLSEIVRDMNKYSTNFIANQLLKASNGIDSGGIYQAGTSQNGVNAMQQLLKNLGISQTEWNIVDGSGLSPDNKMSPNSISQILTESYHRFSFAAEFIASLPIYGIDGTLKGRGVSGGNIKERIRAKTGSIKYPSAPLGKRDNALAISGYLHATRDYAFSLLINGFPPHRYAALKLASEHFLIQLTDILIKEPNHGPVP